MFYLGKIMVMGGALQILVSEILNPSAQVQWRK